MKNACSKYLAIYSAALTIAFCTVVLTGAAANRTGKFDVIDVQRINVLEPDGTLRMTISNKDRFPGLILRGKEHPHERRAAGILFFNDEGTENGGLVFAGGKDVNGKINHFVHLSMDQYEQDQVIALNNIESEGSRRSGLTIGDRPERPVLQDLMERATLEALPDAERQALMKRRAAESYYGADRLFIGRNRDRESELSLMDAAGNTRLRLRVEPDGAASIEFLDEKGRVTGTVVPKPVAYVSSP